MHILLIHQAYVSLSEPGGTRHHELASHLVKKGHQVTVIASPVSYLTGTQRSRKITWLSTEEEDGIRILRTYTYPALHRSFVHRILSFMSFMFSSFWVGLQVSHVDLVWGTSPPIFQGLTAWVLARIKRCRIVFEVRDLWPAFAVALGVLRNPMLIKASEWLETFLYRHTDHLLINSPGFLQHVQERGARQVSLVPNGSDPHMFHTMQDGSDFRTAHHLTGKFVAMYAGAHGMANDLGILLQAADQLHPSKDIIIVLIGDGKDKSSLIDQAATKKLDNVLFLPSFPKKEMPQILAAADCCIAILKPITLFNTVYPNKVFDYMAAERPVVLAIGGVIRELIENTQAGITIPPGDAISLANAIQYLADHPDVRIAMGQRGRRYVQEHFDRAALAEKLEAILLQIVPG